MRPRLLVTALLAAATIPASAAAAAPLSGAGFSAGPAFASANPAFASIGRGATTEGIRDATRSLGGVTVHRGRHGDWDRGDRGRRHRRDRDRDDFGGFYAGPRDGYDLNRNWASDSYNDWWHDRPDRAFPRWMQSNQECERQWWSGGGWRC